MTIRYLDYDTVLSIHADVNKHTRGVLSRSNLLYILDAVREVGNNENEGNALKKKAAFLLFNLITTHPFFDGNKRTAYTVSKTFLRLNGWATRPASEDAKFNFLVGIASGLLTLRDVEESIGRVLIRQG